MSVYHVHAVEEYKGGWGENRTEEAYILSTKQKALQKAHDLAVNKAIEVQRQKEKELCRVSTTTWRVIHTTACNGPQQPQDLLTRVYCKVQGCIRKTTCPRIFRRWILQVGRTQQYNLYCIDCGGQQR